MTATRTKAYQLKIGLIGAKPPIWRRLLIASSTPLSEVHHAIQIAMGWTNSHLHQFEAGNAFYGVPDPDFGFDFHEIQDETRYKLSQLLRREKDSITYEYDFGDSWQHKITLEKAMFVEPETKLPQCLKGKGACPPEDVGGLWGYYGFLEAIADPKHPEHVDCLEWVGGAFDPTALDINEINARLLIKYDR
ncbi:plasmid pRiA4b ORF-3 family protein [Thiorhodococcus mannitoliphagus]|uniref:Plasmid pRiA4b ORF-3 family protein n=1 Tax=Thiorhodococcus mannitoliphagus TaxID=329406 RepID=A0A6P1DSN7_9GAMM|nr:plasmid pRiA4b ORF-3 family protein [Thiorhodococcus mannitoliphagus]NEX19716.1 plasmid pRiA4b ORF-3 family protein [Thiorhodococcus mannitoliphagus]